MISFSLGIFRAKYVNENNFIYLNHKEEKSILVLTTSNGICTYNNKTKNVNFTSWDNVENIEFLDD